MPLKTSDIVKAMNEHIKIYGDKTFFLYDEYAAVYKTIREHHLSRSLEQNFVIECENDND